MSKKYVKPPFGEEFLFETLTKTISDKMFLPIFASIVASLTERSNSDPIICFSSVICPDNFTYYNGDIYCVLSESPIARIVQAIKDQQMPMFVK